MYSVFTEYPFIFNIHPSDFDISFSKLNSQLEPFEDLTVAYIKVFHNFQVELLQPLTDTIQLGIAFNLLCFWASMRIRPNLLEMSNYKLNTISNSPSLIKGLILIQSSVFVPG